MNRRLLDVNVWLAILVRQHEHHDLARRWFNTLAAGEAGLCRLVQFGLIRLLGNRTVMGDDAVSAGEAWRLIQILLEDERVEFAAEPPGLDSVLSSLLSYPVPTGKLVADAYLAAFSLSASLTLVTLDRGFEQFRDLKLESLGR